MKWHPLTVAFDPAAINPCLQKALRFFSIAKQDPLGFFFAPEAREVQSQDGSRADKDLKFSKSREKINYALNHHESHRQSPDEKSDSYAFESDEIFRCEARPPAKSISTSDIFHRQPGAALTFLKLDNW